MGCWVVLCGILVKNRKWIWLHRGVRKTQVDVDKYANYMGFIDITAGILVILEWLFCFVIQRNIIAWYVFPTLLAWVVLQLRGDIKYRIKG